MARPPPKVLISAPKGRKSYQIIQVLNAEDIHVVMYGDRPTGIRQVSEIDDRKKYKMTVFSGNIGHARVLARKLNALFRTNEFWVKTIRPGEVGGLRDDPSRDG
jgi:hypothetical protein